MSKRAFDVLAMPAVVVGALGLYVLPIVRYVVLAKCLGVAALGMLLFVEGIVGGVCRIHPLRSWSWYARRHPEESGLTATIVTHEMINAAAAALVLTLTSRWWSPFFGIDAPAWMFAPLALRAAGLAVLMTFTVQGRVIATLAVFLDAIVTLPLVALVGRSLEAVVFVTTTITLILVVLAAYARPLKQVTESRNVSPTADRVRLGSWLRQLAKDLQRPLFVAVAGIGIVVPLAASATLATLMLAPFMGAAAAKPSPELFRRIVRGIVVAAIAWAFVHTCGAAIYRFMLPASFGDGALMATLAWSALACVPLALFRDDTRASERRKAIAALLSITVLVGLTLAHGATGCLLGIALAPAIAAQSGLRGANRDDPSRA